MRRYFGAVVLLCAMATAAHAESFTFSARTSVVNRVIAPVAGSKTIVAQFSTGDIQAVYPARTVRSKAECATWPAPPGGMFTTSGACVATDPDESSYTVVVSCRFVDDKNAVSDCFGQLTGVAGAYQGRTGTVSWRSTSSADGRESSAQGTGLWN